MKKYIFFISSKFRRAYIIHTVSNYKENTTVINNRIENLQKLLEKKKKKWQNKPLLEPVPTDNQITFCVNNNDHGDSFYQSTHTVDTKHGYHIDAPQKTHYVGTTSNLR